MSSRDEGAPEGGGSPPRTRPGALADGLLGIVLGGLTWLCERVSIERSLAAAAAFGRLWVRVGGPRTRRVREALERALPESPPRERERIAGEVFVHLAQALIELIVLRGRRREELLARVEISGLEHVEAASRATPSGGVLVVTAHLGNWELACAKVASLGIPISVVYRGLRSPALDRAFFALRARSGSEPGGAPVEQIQMGRAGLPVVRALRAGRKVLVLLDQNADRKEGVFVSFFGRPACTRSSPLALAALRGVPVVPAFIHRERGGGGRGAVGHRIEIQPALDLEPGAADDAEILRRNVQRATRAIEEAIRRQPGQWIWTHRRWRTRPRGEEGLGLRGPERVCDDP